MTLIQQLREKCKANPRRILFPESQDPRIVAAAIEISRLGIGVPILLVKDSTELTEKIPCEVEIVQQTDQELDDQCATQLFENRKHKGLSLEAARLAIDDRLLFASLLLRTGYADAAVSGSIATTASVIRAGLYGIGMPVGNSLVSSFFLMQFPDRCWTYADCAVIPNPSSDELATIAINAADNHQILTDTRPRVAMLSFSTKGSAEHRDVEKVRAATQAIQKRRPDLEVDGELQFDAAMLPSVASRKAPSSPVAGNANVFIFPTLDAGNISYKITERLGGAQAIGPIIQGLDKPFMDLSRGCSVDDIVNVAVIASALATKA